MLSADTHSTMRGDENPSHHGETPAGATANSSRSIAAAAEPEVQSQPAAPLPTVSHRKEVDAPFDEACTQTILVPR